MQPLRVVIAEDSLLTRAGLRALVESTDGFRVTAECAGYDELLTVVDADPPDVVVTDIRMPPGFTDEGIRAASELRTRHPEVGVIALSQFLDPSYLLALISDGSARRGYLLKDRVATADQLLSAIGAVAHGGSFIDPLVVESLVADGARKDASPLAGLTVREPETLAQVAQGKSNLSIAQAFGVSDRAVEKHVGSIFTKLDIYDSRDSNRRVKAVLLFLSHQP